MKSNRFDTIEWWEKHAGKMKEGFIAIQALLLLLGFLNFAYGLFEFKTVVRTIFVVFITNKNKTFELSASD